jgi:hypothetical protein
VGGVIALQCAVNLGALQANTPLPRQTSKSIKPSHARQRRFRGTPNSINTARAAPPGTYHGAFCPLPFIAAHPPSALVAIVNVAVPAPLPVMFTGLVEPKLNVGGSTASLGPEVTAAESATLPVNPPTGVMVMVVVFPVVAPAVTVTAVPLIEKPDAGSTGKTQTMPSISAGDMLGAKTPLGV